MNKKRIKDPPEYKQPNKCKGCMWGEWTGTKQFCSKQALMCVKKVNSS